MTPTESKQITDLTARLFGDDGAAAIGGDGAKGVVIVTEYYVG